MADIRVDASGKLTFEGKYYRCAIGANGFTDIPKEGDKATPLGRYPLRECWYRADRIKTPATTLPLRIIHEDDGWCDAPEHPRYNHHVKLPFPASHEKLWLEEHTYDIIVPIGFNDSPVTPGLGSAIFLHLARPDFSPTLGCVAMTQDDLLALLEKISPSTHIVIEESE